MATRRRVGRQLAAMGLTALITVAVLRAEDPKPSIVGAQEAPVVAVAWTGNRFLLDDAGKIVDLTRARDGRLVSVGLDGRVKIWTARPDSRRLLQDCGSAVPQDAPTRAPAPLLSVAVQNDGASPAPLDKPAGGPFVYTGGMDGSIYVWLRSDRPVLAVDARKGDFSIGDIAAVAMPPLGDPSSPDVKNFAVAAKNEVYTVPADLSTAKKASSAAAVTPAPGGDFTTVAIGPDIPGSTSGTTLPNALGAASGDRFLYWWVANPETTPPVVLVMPPMIDAAGTSTTATVDALALSSLGDQAIAVTASKADGLARVWRTSRDTPADVDLTAGKPSASSANGSRIAAIAKNGDLLVQGVPVQIAPSNAMSANAGAVEQLVLSPDGNWLVYALSDKTLHFWDTRQTTPDTHTFTLPMAVTSFRLLAARTDPGDAGKVQAIVATTSGTDHDLLWIKDAPASPVIDGPHALHAPGDAILGAFDPDGKGLILVADSSSDNIQHYDIAHNQTIDGDLLALDDAVTSLVAIQGDESTSDWLAAGTADGHVVVWRYGDLVKDHSIYDVALSPGLPVSEFALSSSPGRLVAADSRTNTLRFFELATAKKAIELDVPKGATGVGAVAAVNPAEGTSVAYVEGSALKGWLPQALGMFGEPASASIDRIALDAQGRVLAKYSKADHSVRVAVWPWDSTSAETVVDVGTSTDVTALGVPDSKAFATPLDPARFAIGRAGGAVQLGVGDRLGPLSPVDPAGTGKVPVQALGFSRATQQVMAGLADGTVAFYKWEGGSAGEPLHLEGPPASGMLKALWLAGLGTPTSLPLDGQAVVSITDLGLGLWRQRAAAPLKPYPRFTLDRPVYSLAWRGDGASGRQQLLAGAGGTIFRFNSTDGGASWSPSSSIATPSTCKLIYALTFLNTATGTDPAIAAACDDGAVRFWDDSGTPVMPPGSGFVPQKGPVYGLAYWPKGVSDSVLGTASADGTLRVYNPSDLSAVGTGTNLDALAAVAAVPPGKDGQPSAQAKLLTLDFSRNFQVWTVATPKTAVTGSAIIRPSSLSKIQPFSLVWYRFAGEDTTYYAYPFDAALAVDERKTP